MNTLESIEKVISAKVRRGESATSIAKGSFFDFSLSVYANIEKDGPVITTNTPEPIEIMGFTKMRKGKPTLRVAEDISSDFCLLIPTSTGNNGQPMEEMISIGQMKIDKPNIEITENSSSDSSNSSNSSNLSLKQNTLNSDLSSKLILIVKPRDISCIAAQSTSRSRITQMSNVSIIRTDEIRKYRSKHIRDFSKKSQNWRLVEVYPKMGPT